MATATATAVATAVATATATATATAVATTGRRPAVGGSARRRPWLCALGGVVAASAVWAGVLPATGYGRATPPGVHGYHLSGGVCGRVNLEPLTDAVTSGGFERNSPLLRKEPALDHLECEPTSELPAGDGWVTSYLVQITVDLHKKTDPRPEFVDAYHESPVAPTPLETDGGYSLPGYGVTTRAHPGLDDLASCATGTTHEMLSVLHGGAVVSIGVDAANVWGGVGKAPLNADGSPKTPALADVTGLRTVLPQTVRHLMATLAA
ncbi:hypothetical protein [Streptomyces sp. ITFR-21]|uniref:hypothetical protein n=1 Tax=Actinacidiphila sp. ITFR-21 TaxID=3075199 RepID=UPI002889D751|nr:hypothetical protein [Streptomyces sp. ITFR-21]WNI16800.1 hypothetical protein RLT57_15600 [Streptomyces sp. ITFR-21]